MIASIFAIFTRYIEYLQFFFLTFKIIQIKIQTKWGSKKIDHLPGDDFLGFVTRLKTKRLRKNGKIAMVKYYALKILPQIPSRKDKNSVEASAQARSVPHGTAGVEANGMFYRANVPNGTLRKNQDINYMTMLKIIPKSKQPLSRRDKISVDYPDPNRSVPYGMAGVEANGMFYRANVPNGTYRGDQA